VLGAKSDNVNLAGTIAVQPNLPPGPVLGKDFVPLPSVPSSQDLELLSKRPNIVLGKFLRDADLIPQHTLDAALILQDMVRSGALDTTQAAKALVRAHNRGGALEANTFLAKRNPDNRELIIIAPALGQILIEAGLINAPALKTALDLQEAVRTGTLSSEEALTAFVHECFGKIRSESNKETPEVERAINLLRSAGILDLKDIQAAEKLSEKHRGQLMKILVTAGKLSELTMEAAIQCQYLVHQQKLKTEQAVIALHYCQRTGIGFDEAIRELGWD
jgi:hypothetical protein